MSGLLDFFKFRSRSDSDFEMESLLSHSYVEFEEDERVIDSYWLIKPFARAVILEKDYLVIEPELKAAEAVFLEKVHRKLREKIIIKSEEELKNKEKILFNEFLKEARKADFEETSIGRMWYYLRREAVGYGKIDAVLRDPHIEDISCSGYNLPVYVYHRAYGSLRTNIVFEEDELDEYVMKLAQKANTQVSLEKPIADATLPTGERIQVTYRKVVSTRGSTFSIRKVSEEPISPIDLVAWGTLDLRLAAILWMCVDFRLNLLITGSTASGKTTMLNALSLFIPYRVKIVSIEDTREVRLPHENWTPFLAKDAEEMFELLKAALRQRPEYMIVGEVRGREAITMFQAMNTGHTTYSTLHAGDATSAINRLIHEPINVPVAMFDALDLLMVMKIDHISGRMVRRVKNLYMIRLREGIKIETIPVFSWNKKNDAYVEENIRPLFEKLGRICGESAEFVEEEAERREKFLADLLSERPGMRKLVEEIESYRNEFYARL